MTITNIDANTLRNWLDNNQAILIDVREPTEHAAEKISHAILLPLGTLNQQNIPNCNGKKLVIHCRSGKRGMSACEKLISENPNLEIYNLEGGIIAWSEAGYPVIKSGKFFLPLDQQVQLTIGLILIISSGLGTIFSPAWFLLTVIIGAGLTIAGLTGFCGLALIMAKMPWNQNIISTKSCNMKP
jgi:rhodanese-related sulfurtransferase